MLGQDTLLAVCKSKIWKVSLKDGSFELDFEIPDNKKLLNFSKISGIDGFEDSICFGEYFNNPHMECVSIWSRPLALNGRWRVVHTFDKGRINHVHNIIPDYRLGAVWILAGDFEQGASIWLAKRNFEEIKVVKYGDQSCRAVWMRHVVNNEYCYATDSQLSINCLTKLVYTSETCEIMSLAEIEGSSIYSGESKDFTVFSTTVEPGESSDSVIKNIFETKPGPGIKSKNACIYLLDGAYNAREIFRAKKDLWPMRLAQFGTFMFPSGIMPQGYVYAYGLAVRKYDNVCLIFKAEK
jgi:hypothetical protein